MTRPLAAGSDGNPIREDHSSPDANGRPVRSGTRRPTGFRSDGPVPSRDSLRLRVARRSRRPAPAGRPRRRGGHARDGRRDRDGRRSSTCSSSPAWRRSDRPHPESDSRSRPSSTRAGGDGSESPGIPVLAVERRATEGVDRTGERSDRRDATRRVREKPGSVGSGVVESQCLVSPVMGSSVASVATTSVDPWYVVTWHLFCGRPQRCSDREVNLGGCRPPCAAASAIVAVPVRRSIPPVRVVSPRAVTSTPSSSTGPSRARLRPRGPTAPARTGLA